jgi:DNA modification methylase
MTPYYADDWLTVMLGDCRQVMAQMEPESVHCVVTSPPYWGLRDYGQDGQLGLEPTPEAYVESMVAVFREVRRVLRSDGTVWLNLGDSYAATSAGAAYGWTNGKTSERDRETMASYKAGKLPPGLKPKDLVGIPWRVAFALQQPYYTGDIKDERDRTWLAALMDGEGTFTILSTTSSSAGSVSYPPIAQVRMTSQGVVAKAASLVGVASPAQYPPSNRGNRAVYQWRLSGGRASSIAQELYPYLIEKRRQALVVWNHQQVREGYTTKRGVFMPDEARAKQQVCRDLIRRMNRGEHVDLPSWMVEPPGMTEPGWYLRSDVIWSKPNPMPESVTDRPTKAHEYLFLLSKSPRYYYDADAVREDSSPFSRPQGPGDGPRQKVVERHEGIPRERRDGKGLDAVPYMAGRNLRSVWTIATQPYPGAHFATFPQALVEPCIKAGTSEKGVCPECGAPWERVVERGESHYAELGKANGVDFGRADSQPGNMGNTRTANGTVPSLRAASSTTTGWRPSCRCEHDGGGWVPVPATVLDPFAGSGTTGLVAQRLSRRAVLIDLNGEYLEQVMDRNRDIPLGLGA